MRDYTAITWRSAPLDGPDLHIHNRRVVSALSIYEMVDEFPCGLLGSHHNILASGMEICRMDLYDKAVYSRGRTSFAPELI